MGFSWSTMAVLDAESRKCEESPGCGKLGVMKSRISLNNNEVMGETLLRKPGFVFVDLAEVMWQESDMLLFGTHSLMNWKQWLSVFPQWRTMLRT